MRIFLIHNQKQCSLTVNALQQRGIEAVANLCKLRPRAAEVLEEDRVLRLDSLPCQLKAFELWCVCVCVCVRNVKISKS